MGIEPRASHIPTLAACQTFHLGSVHLPKLDKYHLVGELEL